MYQDRWKPEPVGHFWGINTRSRYVPLSGLDYKTNNLKTPIY